MKTNTIQSKIKLLGAIFIVLMLLVIGTTIYLNAKNKKDALIINIAGKERMLTQRISKNIFYLYHNDSNDQRELKAATREFIYNLNSLKNGNRHLGISPAPTKKIRKQISIVEILWNDFNDNIQQFKALQLKEEKDDAEIKKIVNRIYNTNNNLLEEVDELVNYYTIYSEQKTESIKYFQYIFALMIIALMIYGLYQLKAMVNNANKFFEYSNQLMQEDAKLEPIKIEAEKEIIQATDTINCFIEKINSAMDYSKNASLKLEEITNEFDQVLSSLNNSADISKQLDKSEDIVIQSQEDLIKSTQKLQKLKKDLDKLILSCKNE